MSEEKTSKPKKVGCIAHGLYAKDVLLPWDDREEFTDLHDGLKKEFFPIGPSEEECVLDLAHLYWQKRTIWRLRAATVLRDHFTDEIVATEKTSWAGIRRGLREKSNKRDFDVREGGDRGLACHSRSSHARSFHQAGQLESRSELRTAVVAAIVAGCSIANLKAAAPPA